MCHMEEILIEGEVVLTKGTLIKKVEQLEKDFVVSFDFFHTGNTVGSLSNLVHFTTQDSNSGVDGHYIPSVWCRDKQLKIDSSVNGNCRYSHEVNFTPYAWHSVSISHEQVDDDIIYSITLDGQKIINIVNTQPKVYQNVKVYASDPWCFREGGKVRNLKLCNGTKVNPDLQCPLCQKLFTDPMLLDCGETLCWDCVEKLVEDSPDKTVACPVCHKVTTVNDTTSLWKNEVMQRKLDAVKLRKGGRVKCSDCEESAAKEFCHDCKSPFCADCANHHRKCARSKKHKMDDIVNVPEQDLQPPAVSLCTQHKKHIEYFCEQCRVTTCIDCTHSKVHRGHDMLLLDEVIDEELITLKKLLTEMNTKWDHYEKYIIDIETFMHEAMEKQKKSRSVIQETFQKVRAELQRAEEERLKLLEEPHQAVMDMLQGAKDSFLKGKGKTRYIAELVDLPSSSSSNSIIKVKHWIEKTCKEVDAALLKGNVEEGNLYNVRRDSITSCEVASLDDNGARLVDLILESAKKVSFHRTVVRLDAEDPSGTF